MNFQCNFDNGRFFKTTPIAVPIKWIFIYAIAIWFEMFKKSDFKLIVTFAVY